MIETIYPADKAAIEALTPERRTAFETWIADLDAEHQRRGSPYGAGPLAGTTGLECWLSYFNDGYSAVDAIAEFKWGECNQAKEKAEIACLFWQAVAEIVEEREETARAEIARLRELLKKLAEFDSYETEYDGRMYEICPSCGTQNQRLHESGCVFVEAREFLETLSPASPSQGVETSPKGAGQ